MTTQRQTRETASKKYTEVPGVYDEVISRFGLKREPGKEGFHSGVKEGSKSRIAD